MRKCSSCTIILAFIGCLLSLSIIGGLILSLPKSTNSLHVLLGQNLYIVTCPRKKKEAGTLEIVFHLSSFKNHSIKLNSVCTPVTATLHLYLMHHTSYPAKSISIISHTMFCYYFFGTSA